jgi:hypothetical protein
MYPFISMYPSKINDDEIPNQGMLNKFIFHQTQAMSLNLSPGSLDLLATARQRRNHSAALENQIVLHKSTRTEIKGLRSLSTKQHDHLYLSWGHLGHYYLKYYRVSTSHIALIIYNYKQKQPSITKGILVSPCSHSSSDPSLPSSD